MSWSHMWQAVCDDCNDSAITQRYTTEAGIRDSLQDAGWIVACQADRITRVICPDCLSQEED